MTSRPSEQSYNAVDVDRGAEGVVEVVGKREGRRYL